MDKPQNIKCLKKEYFVTIDGKPICAPFNDEPGVFDNDLLPIYKAFVNVYDDKVKIVCISTLVLDDGEIEQEK